MLICFVNARLLFLTSAFLNIRYTKNVLSDTKILGVPGDRREREQESKPGRLVKAVGLAATRRSLR